MMEALSVAQGVHTGHLIQSMFGHKECLLEDVPGLRRDL